MDTNKNLLQLNLTGLLLMTIPYTKDPSEADQTTKAAVPAWCSPTANEKAVTKMTNKKKLKSIKALNWGVELGYGNLKVSFLKRKRNQ